MLPCFSPALSLLVNDITRRMISTFLLSPSDAEGASAGVYLTLGFPTLPRWSAGKDRAERGKELRVWQFEHGWVDGPHPGVLSPSSFFSSEFAEESAELKLTTPHPSIWSCFCLNVSWTKLYENTAMAGLWLKNLLYCASILLKLRKATCIVCASLSQKFVCSRSALCRRIFVWRTEKPNWTRTTIWNGPSF